MRDSEWPVGERCCPETTKNQQTNRSSSADSKDKCLRSSEEKQQRSRIRKRMKRRRGKRKSSPIQSGSSWTFNQIDDYPVMTTEGEMMTSGYDKPDEIRMSNIDNDRRRKSQVSPRNSSGWRPLVIVLVVVVITLTDNSTKLQCLASTLTDYDGATFYKAPVGSRVRIACNGSHWSDLDSVSLVLWFKGSLEATADERHSQVPIYTVDARQRPMSQGARHLVGEQYKGRAKFVAQPAKSGQPPYLDLSPLEADDQSEYRCRIDYRSRPRENFLIILFVLVPPKSVQIIDSSGKPIEQIYGPLSEDSDLTLLCLSKGGRPAPSVTWKRRKKVLDDSYLTLNDFLALRQSGHLLQAHENTSSRLFGAFNKMGSSDSDGNATLGQLESLWREWRQWPEFDFMERQTSRSIQVTTTTTDYSPSSVPLDESAALPTGSGQSTPHLLTLNVHESITTAVNVLHLSSPVGRSFYQPLDGNFQPEVGGQHNKIVTGLTDESGRLLVECEASNLHYDLRSLIKLFAPPSLTGSGRQQPVNFSSSPQPPLMQPPAAQLAAAASRQLVESSERALAAAMRGAGERKSAQTGAGQQLNNVDSSIETAAAESKIQSLASGQRLSQIKTETGGSLNDDATTNLKDAASGQFGSSSLELAAGVLYQQLARSHQLSGSSDRNEGTASGGSGSEQPAPAQEPSNGIQDRNPLIRSQLIALDIYFRPADVRLSLPQRPLAAGQLAEFQCQSSGSRPPAKISWLRGGQLIESQPEVAASELHASSNATGQLSKLSLRLEQRDHGQQLTCRAENEHLTRLRSQTGSEGSSGSEPASGDSAQQPKHQQPEAGDIIEDSRTLTVNYAPRLKLELGNKMLSNSIREGTDIYFVCHVDSQPSSKEITWLHNGRLLNETQQQSGADQQTTGSQVTQQKQTGSSGGLIISNNSLVLQRVKLEQGGQYACMAFNSEGLSESNRIELRVLHAPSCSLSPEVSSVRRVPLKGSTRLSCPMDADPAELELSWYLVEPGAELLPSQRQSPPQGSDRRNRKLVATGRSGPNRNASLEQPNEQQTRASANRKTATTTTQVGGHQLSYSVESKSDYGRIYCFASNSIGQQKRPCAWDILPPEPDVAQWTLSCVAANASSSSVLVACDRPTFSASSTSSSELDDLAPDKHSSSSTELYFSVELYSRQNSDQPEVVRHTNQDKDLVAADYSDAADEQPQATDATDHEPEEHDPASRRLLQLEASLNLGPISGDPVFAISNLRPATSYALHLRASGQPSDNLIGDSGSTRLRFATLNATSGQLEEDPPSGSKWPPVTKLEPLDSSLALAKSGGSSGFLSQLLISTRSTGAQQRQTASLGRELEAPSSSRRLPATSSSSRGETGGHFLSDALHSIGALLSRPLALFSQGTGSESARRAGGDTNRRLGGRQQTSQQPPELMGMDDALLAALVCVALLATLTATLLIHWRRRRRSAASGRRRADDDEKVTGSGGAMRLLAAGGHQRKRPPPSTGNREPLGVDCSVTSESSADDGQPTSGGRLMQLEAGEAAERMSAASIPAGHLPSVGLDHRQPGNYLHAASIGGGGGSLQRPLARPWTLSDAEMEAPAVSSIRFNSMGRNSGSGNYNLLQAQGIHISKSRSSLCPESPLVASPIGLPSGSANHCASSLLISGHHGMQRRLISDANLLLQPQAQDNGQLQQQQQQQLRRTSLSNSITSSSSSKVAAAAAASLQQQPQTGSGGARAVELWRAADVSLEQVQQSGAERPCFEQHFVPINEGQLIGSSQALSCRSNNNLQLASSNLGITQQQPTRILRNLRPGACSYANQQQLRQQQEVGRHHQPSSSVVSDESTSVDSSNIAQHCTWSTVTANEGEEDHFLSCHLPQNQWANGDGNGTGQMQFIELLPDGDCCQSAADELVMGKLLVDAAGSQRLGIESSFINNHIHGGDNNNVQFMQQHSIQQIGHPQCSSLTSPSIESSSVKDQPVSSPLSLTNTTLSANTESLLNGRSTQKGGTMTHPGNQMGQTGENTNNTNAAPISILKKQSNSNSLTGSPGYEVKFDNFAVCQCNGQKEPPMGEISFEERF